MLKKLIANTVLMVRPAAFGFNEEAAESNAFQKEISTFNPLQIQEIAELEFDNFVNTLRAHGIQVLVYNDLPDPFTPDAVFPNNWFSTCVHTETIFTYPQKINVRSRERREDITEELKMRIGYKLDEGLLKNEVLGKALEGTGSLVLDHQNKIAYAALSPRTDEEVLDEWCRKSEFKKSAFKAYGDDGTLVYHTNVLMTMADKYVIIALDAIRDQDERNALVQQFKQTGKEIIEISIPQMNAFAGNMLQLLNDLEQECLIMSSSAFKSLSARQIEIITKKHRNRIISVPINVIETIGGGSARCMLAEVFGTKQ